MSSPPDTGGSGPHLGQQPAGPLDTYGMELYAEIKAELDRDIEPNYDTSTAQQRLANAKAARAVASPAEIKKEGVQADASTIASLMKKVHLPVKKKPRMDSHSMASIQKLYKEEAPTDPAEENKMELDSDSEDEEEWLQYFDGQFDQLPEAYQSALREYFKNEAKSLKDNLAILDAAEDTPDDGKTAKFDLIGSLSTHIEFAVEVGKYLRPRDILNLYCISRDFHKTVNGYMKSTMQTWAEIMAPSSAEAFPFDVYKGTCILDPVGRIEDPAVFRTPVKEATPTEEVEEPNSQLPHEATRGELSMEVVYTKNVVGQVRYVPSLMWLQMVVAREIRVRDIIAALARAGHRVAPETNIVLKKLWLIMDLPTNFQRQVMMNNQEIFTDNDLFTAQLFFVKLYMRFNDPVFGYGSGKLIRLLLAQREGFSALWRCLRGKKYTTLREVVQMKTRYDLQLTEDQVETGLPVFGVPLYEVGVGHLEGWGCGEKHLLRVDELVIAEATRRELGLQGHLEMMVGYGRIDLVNGGELAPTLEEMYMSDDDLPETVPDHELGIHGGCGNVPFRYREWTPKQVRKMHWDELTAEEQEAILEDDRDEIRASLAWEADSELDYEPYQDDFEITGEKSPIPQAIRPFTWSPTHATGNDDANVANDDSSSIVSAGDDSIFSKSPPSTTQSAPTSAPNSRAVSYEVNNIIFDGNQVGVVVNNNGHDDDNSNGNTDNSDNSDAESDVFNPDDLDLNTLHLDDDVNSIHIAIHQDADSTIRIEAVPAPIASPEDSTETDGDDFAALFADGPTGESNPGPSTSSESIEPPNGIDPDDELKALSGLAYTEEELAEFDSIDWSGLLDNMENDSFNLYEYLLNEEGMDLGGAFGIDVDQDEEMQKEEEKERLLAYYRRY